MKKNNHKILIFLLGFIWCLPLLELSIIKKYFSITVNNITISGILLIMILIIILFLVICIINIKTIKFNINKITIWLYLLFLYILIQMLSKGFNSNKILLMLWFIVPIIFVSLYIKIVDIYNLNIAKIIEIGIKSYLISVFLIILINFSIYGFDISNNDRLISPGGGPVILAYSISLVYCCYLVLNQFFPQKNLVLITIFSFISILLTGSRGGLWPITIIIIALIIRAMKYQSFNKKIICSFIYIIIGLFSIVLIKNLFPRFLNFSDSGRYSMIKNSLYVFKNFNTSNQIFGYGYGNFFPYIEWLTLKDKGIFINYNSFKYNGVYLLVQPHNTYLFILLELGIFGFALFLMFIISIILNAFKFKKNYFIKLLVIVFIFLNFIESTLLIQPGVSALWLIIIHLSFKMFKKNTI